MACVYRWILLRFNGELKRQSNAAKLVRSARMYDELLPDMVLMLKLCRKDALARKPADETFDAFLMLVKYGIAKNDNRFDWIELYLIVFSFCAVYSAHAMSFSFADFLIRRKFLGKGELRHIVKKYPSMFHTVTQSLV